MFKFYVKNKFIPLFKPLSLISTCKVTLGWYAAYICG